MWSTEFTDEFEAWWNQLTAAEQNGIDRSVALLEKLGPALVRPHADVLKASRYPNMKELRTQVAGRPLRTLFAFDPRRTAIADCGRQNRRSAFLRSNGSSGRQAVRAVAGRTAAGRIALMAGHRNFNVLRKRMSPRRRARNQSAAKAAIKRMLLAELRKLRGATQVAVAAEMGITQSALSRIESQDDMQVSTLRRMVEALGGRLEIVAKLPGRRVIVDLSPSRR